MFIRWLHKIWKLAWSLVALLVITALLTGILVFAFFQLPAGKEYLTGQLTDSFNDQYGGTLKMERVSGMIPWQITIQDAAVFADDDTATPVITVPELSIHLSIWDLLRRQLTITRFSLHEPEIRLIRSEDGIHPLLQAFSPRQDRSPAANGLESSGFGRFQVLAPNLAVRSGRITLDTNLFDNGEFELPRPLLVEEFNTSLFLEFDPGHLFFDIDHFSADLPGTVWDHLTLQGQIYSDNEHLELNGFFISTLDSQIGFSAEANPVNLFGPDLAEQFSNATYRLHLDNSAVRTQDLALFFPFLSEADLLLEPDIQVEGSAELLRINRLYLRSEESILDAAADVRHIGRSGFSYDATISRLLLNAAELEPLLAGILTEEQILQLTGFELSGDISGTPESIATELIAESPIGRLALFGEASLAAPFDYSALLLMDSFNPAVLYPEFLERSHLHGRVELSGSGIVPDERTMTVSAELDSGYVNHVEFNNSRLNVQIENRSLWHELAINSRESRLETSGTLRLDGESLAASLQGSFSDIDLNHLLRVDNLPRSQITLTFNTEAEGSGPDDIHGRTSFQVARSVIGTDTLRPHQLYMDLNAPDGGDRVLRLTSSFLDAELTGDIYPVRLAKLYRHWKDYLSTQLAEEILFDTTHTARPLDPQERQELRPTNLSLSMEMKDSELLQKYFLEEPLFSSVANLNANLSADEGRLLLTASATDPSFDSQNLSTESLSTHLTAGFRYGEKLKENGTVDLQLNTGSLSYRGVELKEAWLNASMRDDSLMIRHSSRNRTEEAELNLMFLTRLLPEEVSVRIDEFRLGSEEYEWIAEGTPRMTYSSDRALYIEELIFVNGDERVEIAGTYSQDFDESVQYRIQDVRLDRISDMIAGRISFAGIMNGDFRTGSLTRIPSFQGDLSVNRFSLDDRLVGDVRINSIYSADAERFDTKISVLTDPNRYSSYLESNDEVGQNLVLTGYLRTPDLNDPDREIFYFDAELHEIDMWIVPMIVPGIVEEMEGSASGSGTIQGSLTDYDFSASFEITDVYGKPVFLNTEYTINGTLHFDRHRGLTFDDIRLRDAGGGTGLLTGTVDLDDFSPTNYMDLTLSMNNLHFMNNPYDPDVPFFASVRGTGEARITGSNFSPFLRTTQPISISTNSRISVPIQDETELEQSQKFIQFVESFDPGRLWAVRDPDDPDENGGQTDPADLTFVERFTLDLQFNANNQVGFQLIFDPVTNEILSANGTGQMRLTLEDQNFSLFGRMSISGGDYQFVAGDIISRRFILQNGGSIIWEGDPANARLNVNAVYRARPDLSSLLAATTGTGVERGQRFPIDLVLNIGGTLGSMENDFYFNLPSGIDGTLDPTLTAQINTLNRNEEEKLLQATSILLSGNFIPPSSVTAEGGSGEALRQSLPAGGAVVVNPLISSQVINPLLSDQINSLLRSDMALDIDFNLTPYNQIDLGVALRLYDDRLILRREGQITGAQSDIGDLGATYRISRTFALTAFHRQDPTLANTSGSDARQTQEMNGVGLEAQVQFNSWREFRHRIRDTILGFFGIREREDDQEALASGDTE